MDISEVLAKYELIVNNTNTNAEHLLRLSEDLQNLSFICHTFYAQKIQNLSTFSDISHCVNEGKKLVASISHISSNKLVLKKNGKEIEIGLIPPRQLVAIFNDNFSADDLKFCEIYFSYLEFFIILNLGVFSVKQA